MLIAKALACETQFEVKQQDTLYHKSTLYKHIQISYGVKSCSQISTKMPHEDMQEIGGKKTGKRGHLCRLKNACFIYSREMK